MKQFKPNASIHDLIFDEFDVDLPICKGTCLSVDDAIVMKVDADYVHNEYLVLDFLALYRLVEWKFITYNFIPYIISSNSFHLWICLDSSAQNSLE